MNNWANTYQINWTGWFWLLLGLFIIYIGISLLQYIIGRYLPYRKSRTQLTHLLSRLRVLYVPVAILMSILFFVAINPMVHGFVVLIMIVLGYNVAVNYVNGVAHTLQREINPGDRVWIDDQKEEVLQIQALGITLQGSKGKRFIPYHKIMENPLVLAAPPKKGIESNFAVLVEDKQKLKSTKTALESLLFTSPYVDSYQTVRIDTDPYDHERILVRCRLVTGNERVLIEMLRDQSYTIELK